MAKGLRGAGLWTALAALLLAGSQVLAGRFPAGAGWPPFGRPVLEDRAFLDMSFVLAGFRRFGGDMAFLQMLQYYGTWHDDETAAGEHAPEGAADLHPEKRLALYGDFLDHGLRIVSLDPYFHFAYLFGSGALAFNLNRPDEALALLERGIRRDPSHWPFRLYAGAIAYRKAAEPDKVIALLEEAVRDPDCPTLLLNILANLHKKNGNPRRAAEVLLHILETSRDDGYRVLARQKLEVLRRDFGVPF